jgi:hypothetical protein
MIDAQRAMEQAAATADYYASRGVETYQRIFCTSVDNNPAAAARFLAGFMQAASTDFAAWAVQEKLDVLGMELERLGNLWVNHK